MRVAHWVAVSACATIALASLACQPTGDSGKPAADVVRAYPVEEQGFLEIRVPGRWEQWTELTDGERPVHVNLFAERRRAALALGIGLESAGSVVASDPDALREFVRENAEKGVAKGGVELKEFRGPEVFGYVFTARNSVDIRGRLLGNYDYRTQGAFSVGPLVIVGTALSNDSESREMERALDVLRSMRHVDAPSPGAEIASIGGSP